MDITTVQLKKNQRNVDTHLISHLCPVKIQITYKNLICKILYENDRHLTLYPNLFV